MKTSVNTSAVRGSIPIPASLQEVYEQLRQEAGEEAEQARKRHAEARTLALARQRIPGEHANEDTHPVSVPLWKAINSIRQRGDNLCEIAAEFGVDQSTLWRFMASRGGLSLANVDHLASCLGLQLISTESLQRMIDQAGREATEA